MLGYLLNYLTLPEITQIKNLDDPDNIYILRNIIRRKPFLNKTYKNFYKDILEKIKTVSAQGEFIELGSGAGFIKAIAPNIVTSDVLPYSGIDRVFSALDMPMQDASVSAFMMIDVLHHIKDSRIFFKEMQRCLNEGGKIVMIEPANTIWARFIYTNFHHEPFETNGEWKFEDGGPLTGANMAIPWIIFDRDIKIFTSEFPHLKICSIRIHTPLKYLLSGGLSMKQLLPSCLYPLIELIEWLLSPLNRYVGMFMTIELEKTGISE
jgi:SAM-dependent methyltransferase